MLEPMQSLRAMVLADNCQHALNVDRLTLKDDNMFVSPSTKLMAFAGGTTSKPFQNMMQFTIRKYQSILLHQSKIDFDDIPRMHFYGLPVISLLLGVPDIMPQTLRPCFEVMLSDGFAIIELRPSLPTLSKMLVIVKSGSLYAFCIKE